MLKEGFKEQSERKRYLKISKGVLKERVPKGTEGAFESITEEGKVIYDRHFASFTGKLVSVKYKESDRGYKGQYYFDMEASGEIVSIIANEGTAANVLINKLLNCNLQELILIKPYYFEDEKKLRIVLIQEEGNREVKIKPFYNKDNGHEKYPTLEKEWNELSVYDQNAFKQSMDLFFHEVGLKQLQEKLSFDELEERVTEVEEANEIAAQEDQNRQYIDESDLPDFLQ